jgi:hypothetical protein
MKAFFHGWRRKAGVVTLVMALALLLGWMRSHRVEDVISFRSGEKSQDAILVSEHRVIWARWYWRDGLPRTGGSPTFRWSAERHSINPLMFFHRLTPTSEGSLCGFEHARYVDRLNDDQESFVWSMWAASYWSLIVPLTLLAAYLILWKPRKRV